MDITFHCEDIQFDLPDDKQVIDWLKKVVVSEEKELGEISIVFTSDEYLLKVNNEYLKHDYFTDIITFDYCNDIIVSGDLLISVDRVQENAKSFGVSFITELRRVIVHGVLHLCGYKDKTDEEQTEMREKEDTYLAIY